MSICAIPFRNLIILLLIECHDMFCRTKKAWRTVDPHWNESFLFENSSTFPLHSAAYFQLLVLDKSRKGSKDELMGVVFIPMSEFFSDEAVSGMYSAMNY